MKIYLKSIYYAFICGVMLLPPSVLAQQKAETAQPKQAAPKAHKTPQTQKTQHRGRPEKLYCTLGTEDRQARIAVELFGGKVHSIAYYSKWKPRTCSVHIIRDDSYSKWEDTGNHTVVTLIEDKGAFLIDHERNRLHFIFRNIDRERFCGMEGRINGSLTVWRGKPQCGVEGVMDEHPQETPEKKP